MPDLERRTVMPKPPPPPRPPSVSPKNAGFWDLRDRLVDKLFQLKADDLAWFDVQLAGGACKVQVCHPVVVRDGGAVFYVPVTPQETWALAKDLGAFPLTRAVCDQAHNQAHRFPRDPDLDASRLQDCFDFPRLTDYLRTRYYTFRTTGLASGAHKLWVLSARGNSINHGFYVDQPKGQPPGRAGYLDPAYRVIQNIGAWHGGMTHWDYSQLLQLMRYLTDGGGGPLVDKDNPGKRLTLRRALANKHPAVWDEPSPLSAKQLDMLPDA
jgi:hypothetical protein